MSLINDALKRAKEAHQQVSTPPPDLPFRPVEPSQQPARRSLGLLLPAFLAVVALLVLLLAWQWVQRIPAAAPTEAAARTALPHPAPAQTPPTPVATEMAAAAPAPASQPQLPVASGAATSPAETAVGVTNSSIADVQDSQGSNAVPVAIPEPPKPSPLRLQTIFFNPKRPTAVISGKSVCVGDKVGDLRVLAIDQESATLVGAGKTNVLTLAQ
jgi:hypothetical protein